MKLNIKRLFIMAFAFMVLMPLNIYAIDLSKEDFEAAKAGENTKGLNYDSEGNWFTLNSGEYKITEDIDLEEDTLGVVDDNVVILDLNGKTLTSANEEYSLFELYDSAKATITGNGTLEKDSIIYVSDGANLIIENGTFNGNVTLYSEYDEEYENNVFANLTVNGGTFNGNFSVEGDFDGEIDIDYYPVLTINNASIKGNITVVLGKLVFNDGTVDATEANADAVYVWNGSSAIINGGTFKSQFNGLMAEIGPEGSNLKSVVINGGTFIGEEESGAGLFTIDKLEINGGTFTGGIYGVYFADNENMLLKGGIFKATSESGAGLYTMGESEEALTSVLAEGYVYDPELEATVSEKYDSTFVASQKEISVINPSENDFKFLDGENAEYAIDVDDVLTFRINANYSFFENGGKVYVDDELVESSNYTSLSGSTIIKLKKEYVSSLKAGEHTFKVAFNNGKESSTKFTIKVNDTTKNPQTSDNILIYVSIMLISFMGLGTLIYKMRKEN